MQAAHQKIRRTPFGDCYGYRAERLNPFNVRTRERNAPRRASRLSAAALAEIRPELDRLGLSSTMPVTRGTPAQTLSGVILRLTCSLLRLALRGVGAHLLEKMRRAAPIMLNDYRRRAWLGY